MVDAHDSKSCLARGGGSIPLSGTAKRSEKINFMNIYVGGINGSGKTTISKEIAERLGIEYISTSRLMMEKIGRPSDYEYLRSVPGDEQMEIREEMFNELASQKDRNLIADSHYLNLIRGNVNVITRDAIKKFDILVLISAPTEQVWTRIHKDETKRDRALFPENLSQEESFKMLKSYQEETRQEFLKLAKIHDKKSIEIINPDGGLESSIEELVDFLKQC